MGASLLGPAKMTAEQRTRLLAALTRGLHLKHAASNAGLASRTVYNWLERAKQPKPPKAYRAFSEDVEKARDQGLAFIANDLRTAARTDWRAAAWMLSRLDEGWRDPERVEARKLAQQQAAHAAERHAVTLRRASAEAKVAEAKARIAEAASHGEVRGVVLTPVDLLQLLDEVTRRTVEGVLLEHGLALRVLQSLLDDIDEAEMIEATGLGAGGALPLLNE